MNADVEKLNAEIALRAERLCDVYGQYGLWEQRHVNELREAVAAKRAAMQQKPLSAEEAETILYNTQSESMAAVLAECRKRDLAVIDKALMDAHYVETAPCRDIVRRILGSALDGRSA